MSPVGCPNMLATLCNRNADESCPVLRLNSREQKSPTPLLIQDKDVLPPSTDPTGRHAIHPHRGGEFRRQLPNHPYHRMLRGGIEHATPTGVEAGDGGSKDHTALGLDERRQGRFCTGAIGLVIRPVS